MRSLAIVALLSVIAFASAAEKLASNHGVAVGTATASTGTSAAAPIITNAYTNGPTGILPQTALEWFRFDTDGCYELWAPATPVPTVAAAIPTAISCGVLPSRTDDVILGFGTGVAGEYVSAANAIFISFNSPRQLCAAATTTPVVAAGDTCAGMDTQSLRPAGGAFGNANISTLTIRQRATTSAATALTPVVFTGYPRFTEGGVYSPTVDTWTVAGSSVLRVFNGVFINHPNSAIYGSGYGVTFGGLDAGANALDFGNAAYSAESAYGATARGGARNGLHGTDARALAWAAIADNIAAVTQRFGFILETSQILVNPCSYGTVATLRCTGVGAVEIQGPNLYIQPITSNVTAPAAVATPDVNLNATFASRVNITIDNQAILFTSAVNYINVDFYVAPGGILAFCEPSRRQNAATSFAFSSEPVAATPTSVSDAAGNSYTQRGYALAGCSTLATVAFDWFGAGFTSVRVINNGGDVVYSDAAPTLAKIAAMYGPAYTIPVIGNITINIGSTLITENPLTASSGVPTGVQTTRFTTTPAAALLGAPLVAVAPATPGTYITSDSFLGMHIPYGPYGTTDGSIIPFVTSYDCARFSSAMTVATNVAGSETPLAQPTGQACSGLPMPSRFTFFGGVATFSRQVQPSADANPRQLIALTQWDLLIAGDGVQRSTLQFGSLGSAIPYQLCGRFATRASGTIEFVSQAVVLSSALGQVAGNIRRSGQPFTTEAYLTAGAGNLPAAAPTAVSTYQPDPRVTTLVPTFACTGQTAGAVTGTPGTGCPAGNYAILFTLPADAAQTSGVASPQTGVNRSPIVEVICSAGSCTPRRLLDAGCATTFPAASYFVTGSGCTVPPVATFAAGDAPGAAAQAIATNCTAVRFEGLQQYPSVATAGTAVGQVVLNTPTTVNQRNFSVASTVLSVRSTLAVASFQDTESAGLPTVASQLVAENAAAVYASGAISTDASSSVLLLSGSNLTVTTGGSVGGGNFVASANSQVLFAGTPVSITGPAAFSGAGSLVFAGSTAVTAAVTSSIANSTVVNGGVLSLGALYTQSGGNLTVSGGAVIGASSAAAGITLTNGAALVFGAGAQSTGAAGSPLAVTLSGSASRVVVLTGAAFVSSVPVTITQQATSTVGAVVIVAGSLTLPASSIIAANTTIVSGGLLAGVAQIGQAGARTTVEVQSGALAAALTVTNGALLFSGASTISGATTLTVASGSQAIVTGAVAVPSTLTVASGDLVLRAGTVSGAGTVTVNSGARIIAESGANQLTPSSLVNNGVISVNDGATLTVTSCISGSGNLQGPGAIIFSTSTGCVSSTGVSELVNTQLLGTTTVGGGLTILTGVLSGTGSIATGSSGFIAINNDNAELLTVSGTPTVGSASAAQDAVVVSGRVVVVSGSTLNLGSATVGIRPETSPFTPVTSNGVVFILSGNLNLLSSLLVPAGATLNATATITGNSLVIAQGGRLVGAVTLGSSTVLTLQSGAIVGPLALSGGQVVANGAFVINSNTTIASPITLVGSITVPAGVVLTLNGFVTCVNNAQIIAATGGRVLVNANYIGCQLSGDAFGGSGSLGNGTTTVTLILPGGVITLTPGVPFVIGAFTNVTVVQAVRVLCPAGTSALPCEIQVLGSLNLFGAYTCFDAVNTTQTSLVVGTARCALPGVFTTGLFVRITVAAGGRLFIISFGATNQGLRVLDAPTYPVGTVDQLVLNTGSRTIFVATGNQINPLIVRNFLQLGGVVEVQTNSFVPLHPTVLIRLLNGPVRGAFSSAVITYDQSRSAHPWAWNLGFPTVRVVGQDVVLDPNGNGTNGANGVSPSILVALLAVVAALFFRN